MPAILNDASFWRIVVTASFAILLAVVALVLRSKTLSVAGLFYVWGLEKVDVDKLHPPFVTRFQMISSEASRVMKRDFPNSAKKFLATFLSALRAMDASVRLIGDSLSPSQRIAVAAAITSDWAEAYRKELADHWKEIRADMRSLSRVGTRRAD